MEKTSGDWFLSLSRLNRICAVKIDRQAQNSKELTVHRGELIEIEDSSKKWWYARNFRGEVGYVPNNILEEIEIEHRPIVSSAEAHHLNSPLLFRFFFRKSLHRFHPLLIHIVHLPTPIAVRVIIDCVKRKNKQTKFFNLFFFFSLLFLLLVTACVLYFYKY